MLDTIEPETGYRSVRIGPKLRELRTEANLAQSKLLRELCLRRGGQLHPFLPQRSRECRACRRPHAEHLLDAAVVSCWEGGNRYRSVPGRYLDDLVAILTAYLGRDVTVLELAPEALDSGGPTWTPPRPETPATISDQKNEASVVDTQPYEPVTVATVSGYSIGGTCTGPGPGAPGRTAYSGIWELRCLRCRQAHAMELGRHAPRICLGCGAPLAAAVGCTVVSDQT
jgi:hypothetical protein